MAVDSRILHPPEMQGTAVHGRTSHSARLFALGALVGITLCCFFAARLIHSALTDAWVAPLQLSPDNERVLDLRIRQTKEKADRARLVAELAGIEEEVQVADLGLQRLRSLAKGYGGALAWSTHTQGREIRELDDQVGNLESQHELLKSLIADHERLLRRSEANRAAGFITDDQYEREGVAFQQLEVALRDSELQLSRATAARTEAFSREQALTTALANRNDPEHRSVSPTSPDVLKFYDDPRFASSSRSLVWRPRSAPPWHERVRRRTRSGTWMSSCAISSHGHCIEPCRRIRISHSLRTSISGTSEWETTCSRVPGR